MQPTSEQPSEFEEPAAPGRRSARFRRASRNVARVIMVVLLVALPLWQGGASVAAVGALAALTALLWLASVPAVPHRKPQLVSAWLFAGLGVYTVLQCVPLPLSVVRALNPLAAQLHEQAAKAAGLPPSSLIALATAPGDTALQAAVYLLAAVNCLLFANLLLGSGGRRMKNWFINAMAVSALAVGLVHAAATGGVADLLPAAAQKAVEKMAFVNANHAAGYLNLALGITLGRAVYDEGKLRQLFFGTVSLGLIALTVATGSRGGMIVILIVLLATLASSPEPPRYMRIDRRKKELQARYRAALLVAVAALSVAIVGWPAVERELLAQNDHGPDSKVEMLKAVPALAAHAPLLGWGQGGLAVQLFATGRYADRHDFAENLLLERLADNGWVGLLLFVAGLVWMARKTLRLADGNLDRAPYVVAAIGFLAGNLVDFSFEMAGCLVPFACTCAMAEFFLPISAADRERMMTYRTRFHRRVSAFCAVLLAAAIAALGLQANGGLTRDVDAALLRAPDLPAALREWVGQFAYDAHAAYLIGRRAADAKQFALAERLLDRAVQMRPNSGHARLFRFAVRAEMNHVEAAAADLRWLLEQKNDSSTKALTLCLNSPRAQALLVALLPQIPELAYNVAEFFEKSRPDIVEQVALELRRRYPDRRFAIEVLRARLYMQRGAVAAARSIAAGLMARQETMLDGFAVEGHILGMTGKFYEAFHLLREVCDKRPDNPACGEAAWTVLSANKPALALEFLRNMPLQWHANPASASLWWRWQAAAQMQADNWDEALEAARRSYNLQPTDVNAGLMLADCLFHNSLHGELAELADRLTADFPGNAAVAKLVERVQQAGRPLTFGARREMNRAAPPAPPTPTMALPPPGQVTPASGGVR